MLLVTLITDQKTVNKIVKNAILIVKDLPMKKLSFTFLLFLSILSSNAQTTSSQGTEFWLGYMENLDLLFNPSPQFAIYVSADEAGSAQVIAAATGLTFDFEYQANTVTEFLLPTGIYYAEGSEAIANFGLKILTDSPTRITGVHYRPFFSEASMLLPIESLGSEYVVAAALDFNNFADAASSFVIVATEDNTTVEITPSGNTLGLRPANVPFTIELEAGNSYQVQSLFDLSGSKVSTNGNKVAVFAGAQRGNIGCELADNHIYDQVAPVELAGTDYAFIPFIGQTSSIFKVLALSDATEVNVDGFQTEILNEGEFIEYDLTSPAIMESSSPVVCTQFSKSFNCSGAGIGDPNMIVLHPMGYRLKSIHFENLSEFAFGPAFSRQFVNLMIETVDIDMVSLDNIDIDWSPFPGNLDFSFAQIEVTSATSSLLSGKGVQAIAYGFGDYDAYTYHLGFDVSVDPNSTAEIDESFIRISPNPTNDFVVIEAKNLLEKYALYNQAGQLVLESKSANSVREQIDISTLSSGIYFLRIHTASQVHQQKIIKVN